MSELLKHYEVKLYNKDGIINWNLPKEIKKKIGLKNFDYFFLASSKEEKHGTRHAHFSLYPTKYDTIYLIEVKVPQILPDLLGKVLKLLKEEMRYDILTSTGFCTGEKLKDCHFGVFFSSAKIIDKKALIQLIKELENVEDVRIFSHTCEGCKEE
jgi:hypothetical protein